MKILQLIPTVDPKHGGPREVVRQLGQALTLQGHKIEVASLDDPQADHVRHFPLRVHALGPALMNYGYSARMAPWLKEFAGAFDCMIVNGLWQYPGLAAWRAARSLHMPYFVFTHGMLDPWFKRSSPLKHMKKWLYWPWAEYQVLRNAHAVFFTCERERVLARESFWLYQCNERVVNMGITRPATDLQSSREAFFQLHPELRGERFLLFLSRIHPKKGCDLLIEAFGRVASRAPLLKLVMAGPDGDQMRPRLEAQAKRLNVGERIAWTGMLNGDAKWGAFAAAEAFVLPSHQENFGLAVVEALAAGVPALISNQINICDEIEHDGAGIVCPDDASGTLKLLETWIAMPESERERMRRRARECFERRFEIEGAARSLIESLRACGVSDCHDCDREREAVSA